MPPWSELFGSLLGMAMTWNCVVSLPTAPGDAEIYWQCEGVIIAGDPVKDSSGQIIIDYMPPLDSTREDGEVFYSDDEEGDDYTSKNG